MTATEDIQHIRHSLAHLLAAAVLELYPSALPTIGPATDTGFYYDFDFKDGEKVSQDDLARIEEKMREIMKEWNGFERIEVGEKDARDRYKDNPYKLELIDEIVASGEPITLYQSGDFIDLCRGGHVETMQRIDPEAFTLTSIAGAYWRGDENNPMLTRIYGAAFQSKEELEEHLERQRKAAERDHRKIGKELDLFTFSDLVGPGLPLFTPKGALIRDLISEKLKTLNQAKGYTPVAIPHLTKRDLYDTSGHTQKFGDELFRVYGAHEQEFVLKPMNCPHHTQIYASSPKSYRDLPIRYMETTTVYRDEQAGELLGLSRARSITQDDGHVFCTPNQIEHEIESIIDVIREFYTSLGMFSADDFVVGLSTRDPNEPEKYLGDDERWNSAEAALEKIAGDMQIPVTKEEGEAAFYGPKLDFHFEDALGRPWQLATIQLDFMMPERFGLEYTDSDGSRKTPVMIHRAITGSLERFMAVMIEHFAGAFPFWLSPTQVKVLPISDDHREYADSILAQLQENDVRAELDASDDSLGKRIYAAKKEKVPYMIVIGDQEVNESKVTLEGRDEGKIGQISIDELIDHLGGSA